MVVHAWWGLVQDFVDVCDRLAAEGFVALAPDLFEGRTAATPAEAGQVVEAQPSRLPEAITAVTWLLDRPDLCSGRVAFLGFSYGANLALRAAASGVGQAVVAFYGTASPDRLGGLRVPVLGHFAAQDQFEPAREVATLFGWLAEKGVPASSVTYLGTSHWFFEPSRKAYRQEAAERAWTATLAFLRKHLA